MYLPAIERRFLPSTILARFCARVIEARLRMSMRDIRRD